MAATGDDATNNMTQVMSPTHTEGNNERGRRSGKGSGGTSGAAHRERGPSADGSMVRMEYRQQDQEESPWSTLDADHKEAGNFQNLG